MTAATTPATDAEIAEWLQTVEKYPSLKKQKGTFAHRLIARIHQEREKAIRECAEKCREQQSAFLSPEYATGQPLSSFSERFACSECEREILSLIEGRQP